MSAIKIDPLELKPGDWYYIKDGDIVWVGEVKCITSTDIVDSKTYKIDSGEAIVSSANECSLYYIKYVDEFRYATEAEIRLCGGRPKRKMFLTD